MMSVNNSIKVFVPRCCLHLATPDYVTLTVRLTVFYVPFGLIIAVKYSLYLEGGRSPVNVAMSFIKSQMFKGRL